MTRADWKFRWRQAKRRKVLKVSSDRSLESLTREELEELVRTLRSDLDRLRSEIRLIQRDRHETPPHYL